jgi:hypothetical protein
MLKVSPPIYFPQICTICIKESLCMAPGSGNTRFSQNNGMLRSRNQNKYFSWKPSQYASSLKTENTMDALMEYANWPSALCNDFFGIIWREANPYTKVWIYDGLCERFFSNKTRLGQMQQDIDKILNLEISNIRDTDIDDILNDTGASFMPASLLTHLNAPACMQTSARPNPYIVQALNR